MKIIILAGGSGTRLWPYSRSFHPKQFIHFGDGESLLRKTLNRFIDAGYEKDLWICSNQRLVPLIKQEAKEFSSRIISEPMPRNTGPAIIWAVKYLIDSGNLESGECFLVTPSDHILSEGQALFQELEKQVEVAKKGNIITFGITPYRAETGYGYMQLGRELQENIFQVDRFIEKPDLKKAEELVQRKDIVWNSGMFLFERDHFIDELKKHQPEYYHFLQTDGAEFKNLPALSIDHALMEKSSAILTSKLTLKWSDVGSWDSVYEMLQKDDNGNVLLGNVYAKDTENSLVMGGKRLISTNGVKDMLILETEDALFISPRGTSQEVKQMVEELKKKGKRETEDHLISKYSWGEKTLIGEGEEYLIEKIHLFRGRRLASASKHLERWIVLQGEGTARIEDQLLSLTCGQQFSSEPEQSCELEGITDLLLMKTSLICRHPLTSKEAMSQ